MPPIISELQAPIPEPGTFAGKPCRCELSSIVRRQAELARRYRQVRSDLDGAPGDGAVLRVAFERLIREPSHDVEDLLRCYEEWRSTRMASRMLA